MRRDGRSRLLLARGLFEGVVVASYAPLILQRTSFFGVLAGFFVLFVVATVLPPSARRSLPILGGTFGALVALLFSVPVIPGAASGIYAGWRSAQVVRTAGTPYDAEMAFMLGLVVFILGAVIGALTRLTASATLGAEALAIVVLGFLSILVVREKELVSRSRTRRDISPSEPFLLVGVSFLGLLALLSGLLAVILSPQAAAAGLAKAGAGLIAMLTPVFAVLGYVVQIVGEFANWFLSHILHVQRHTQTSNSPPSHPAGHVIVAAGNSPFFSIAVAVAAAIAVGLILWGLWRLLTEEHRAAGDGTLFQEERERLFGPYKRPLPKEAVLWPYSASEGALREGVRELLRTYGRDMWTPRRGETLREWCRRAVGEGWNALLAAYEGARYGVAPPAPEDPTELLEAARRVAEARLRGNGAEDGGDSQAGEKMGPGDVPKS